MMSYTVERRLSKEAQTFCHALLAYAISDKWNIAYYNKIPHAHSARHLHIHTLQMLDAVATFQCGGNNMHVNLLAYVDLRL